jgi:hypothetical protein
MTIEHISQNRLTIKVFYLNFYEKRSSCSCPRDVSPTTFFKKSANVCLIVSISSALPLNVTRGISEKRVAKQR